MARPVAPDRAAPCCDCGREDLPRAVDSTLIAPAHVSPKGTPCLEGTKDSVEPTPVWLIGFNAEREHVSISEYQRRNLQGLLEEVDTWTT